MTFIDAGIAFLAMFITDFCWAIYVNSVKNDAPLKSSFWALFLFLMGGVAVISYTTNPWLLIPAGAGAFVGTYVGVLINMKR